MDPIPSPVSLYAGRHVVLPLCGGNVDTPVLGRVLERGMAADGRLVKFEVGCEYACACMRQSTVGGECLRARRPDLAPRLTPSQAVVSDRPGGIASLTKLLAECRVSIKDIYHERAWSQDDIATVRVRCIVESADRAAAQAMITRLQAAGYEVRVAGVAWRRYVCAWRYAHAQHLPPPPPSQVDVLSKLDANAGTTPATITGTPSKDGLDSRSASGAPL